MINIVRCYKLGGTECEVLMPDDKTDPRDQAPHLSPPPSTPELFKLVGQGVMSIGILVIAWLLLFGKP